MHEPAIAMRGRILGIIFATKRQKMSQGLRIALEKCPWDAMKYNWQPFYLVSSGESPPCYAEFMKAMECLQTSNSAACAFEIANLKVCLIKHGHDLS